MTDTLRDEMAVWLEHGDDAQRQHAAFRLAMLDGLVGAPVQTPPHVPRDTPAWLVEVNTCLYRGCRTGCQKSQCHAGRGERWYGEVAGEVSLADCKACLAERRNPG